MDFFRSLVSEHVREHGPIPTLRVSVAQARGNAKKYAYWGAVPYVVRLRKSDGMPTHVALQRASSDRRSRRLACLDALEIAQNENRILLDSIGPLTLEDSIDLLYLLSLRNQELADRFRLRLRLYLLIGGTVLERHREWLDKKEERANA